MPALALLNESSTVAASHLSSSSTDVLQVVCAWPISGQYGPGSRILYYVLIATCLVARRVGWLVNACLAVALLLPAVAALHGIVLAAVHVEGAVDMDIFGAFQLCSIGILVAPVTVMLSKTFFNDPGRNIIFLWALLILIGLLSLVVEFYRAHVVECPWADADKTIPVSSDPNKFPYDKQINCGLTCSPELGPKSPMRGGAVDNVYVIPSPEILSFGTTTLLAAACSLHAILCLVSMWNKVLKMNWKKHFGSDETGNPEERVEGANGATRATISNINTVIGHYLSMVAIPVFGGAGVAIMIVGEINFFSKQISYQTEPMASVGQWTPIVGTGLGLLGSLYLLLWHDVEEKEKKEECDCHHHHHRRSLTRRSTRQSARGCPSPHSGHSTGEEQPVDSSSHDTRDPSESSEETQSDDEPFPPRRESHAGRLKVASFLNKMGDVLGSPPRSFLRDESLKDDALGFPQVPAEELRHLRLQETRDTYAEMVDYSHSQAPSVRASSPSSRASRSRSPKPRASTLPSRANPSDPRYPISLFGHRSHVGEPESRVSGESLTVPSAVHIQEPQSPPPTTSPVRNPRRRISSPARYAYGASRAHASPTSSPTVDEGSAQFLSPPRRPTEAEP